MKKNLHILTFFILLASWVFAITHEDAISMASSNQTSEKSDKEFSGFAKVTDGDTIKIDDKKIRLLYLDAPESKQLCFNENYEEYLCGKVSTEFLTNLTKEKPVKCFYEKLDKYGRYLSECFIDKLSINQEIVRNGMAVTYFFGPAKQEFLDAQAEAKTNHRGIWQGAFELPKDYRKKNKNKLH